MQRTQQQQQQRQQHQQATEWTSASAWKYCAAGRELQMGQQHMYGCTFVLMYCIYVRTYSHAQKSWTFDNDSL